jgi:hypothetical protein
MASALDCQKSPPQEFAARRRQRNLTVFPAACTWEKLFYLYILTTKCFPVVDLVWPALDALPARRSVRFLFAAWVLLIVALSLFPHQ